MGRKRRKYPLIKELLIESAGSQGKALGRHQGQVVFVEKTVPGDVVDVQVNSKKKGVFFGYPTEFHSYSDKRAEAFCEHFGTCGGCKWQHMEYKHQVFYKHKQVKDNLERIGKMDLPEINPILGSAETTFYRNKLEFTFSDKRWLTKKEIDQKDELERNALGFHIPGRYDKILDIEKCWLQPDPSNAIRNSVKEFAIKNGLSFYNVYDQNGLLRNLIIRTTSTGETMVIVCFSGKEDKENRKKLLEHLKTNFSEITSLLYLNNHKKNDTIYDLEVFTYAGKDHIIEEMERLKFKIGPKSFYQTNSKQAYELYKVARDFANLSGDEIVYDLYTGTGTIANFIAKNAQKVIGVECVPEAIEDAFENSKNNNITNTSFFAGEMKDIFNNDFIAKNGTPDVIITDPPRAGMHPSVVEKLNELKAKRIVYISCNPATQARDLAELAVNYNVKKVQPVDMFPHTHHVENVVLLELKK